MESLEGSRFCKRNFAEKYFRQIVGIGGDISTGDR